METNNISETDIDLLAKSIFQSAPKSALKQFYEENKYWKYQNDPVKFGEDILEESYTEDIKKLMYSVRDFPITIAISATGVGKCVDENERILLADGSMEVAKDLIGKSFNVISFDKNKTVSAFAFNNGIESTYEIKTKSGRKIVRTGNHPLYCGRLMPGDGNSKYSVPIGWKEINNIENSDIILVPSHIPNLGTNKKPIDHVKLCAYLLGDGGVTHYISFSQKDGIIKDEFCDISKRLGCEISIVDNITVKAVSGYGKKCSKRNPIKKLVKKWGMFGKKSIDKSFPNWVFQLPDDQLSIFINRLFSCDGWAYYKKLPTKCRTEIGYCSSSKKLIRDLEICMIRLGIRGKVSNKKVKYQNEIKNSWVWSILKAEEIIKFKERIGIFGKEEAVNKVYNAAKESDERKTPKWHKYGYKELYHWERVKSIKYLGKKNTVGISVPDGNTYLTTFVEHNTFSSASIALWYYKCFAPDVKVFTAAAPPENNLKIGLWGEINSRLRKHPDLFKDDIKSVMNIVRHPESFITGVTIATTGSEEEREAKFSGKHSPYLLFVLDEGDAIPDAVYRGIEGCMSGGHARLLVMFNPKRQAGTAYKLIKDGKANVVHLTAFGHPNVETGKNIIPGAVDREKTIQRIHEMTESLNPTDEPDEKTCFKIPDFLIGVIGYKTNNEPYPPLENEYRRIINPQFYYQVLGEYPATGSNKLIPTEWIDRARSNWDLWKAKFGVKPPKDIKPIVGFDVADEGDDSNALCYRYGNWVDYLNAWNSDVVKATERAAFYISGRKGSITYVDKNGMGMGVAKILRKNGVRAKGIFVQESPEKEEKKPKAEFNKLRDQLWWEVREWLKGENAMLPPDNLLIEELDAAQFEENLRGKICVSDKAFFKSKDGIGRSPDRADALCLTFVKKDSRPRIRMIDLR